VSRAWVVPDHVPVASGVGAAGVVQEVALAVVPDAGDVALRPGQRRLHHAVVNEHLQIYVSDDRTCVIIVIKQN
jgi:hypothetical protein